MKTSLVRWPRVAAVGMALSSLVVLTLGAFAAHSFEVEPNNTPATANPVVQNKPMEGAIQPAGDVDYFTAAGVNINFPFWGYTAVLETDAAVPSQEGLLSGYRSDGVTAVQTDSGSWLRGPILAFQSFVDGSSPVYVRVSESGDDQALDPYLLRYYQNKLTRKPEAEPNDTPAAATTASATNIGAITPASDVDCFAAWGLVGQRFAFILQGDPENDGSSADLALRVYQPGGALLTSADHSGVGKNEFIDDVNLPEEGTYAYCVYGSSGVFGPNATYQVGLLQNSRYWTPGFKTPLTTWLDPRPGAYAQVGDLMHFQSSFTNPVPLRIPDPFRFFLYVNPACVSIVDAPGASSVDSTTAMWQQDGLDPSATVTVDLTLKALAPCDDKVGGSASIDYYILGMGLLKNYRIGSGVYAPLVVR